MEVLDRSVKGGLKLLNHKGAWEYPESAGTDTRKAEPVGLPYPRNPTIGFLSPPAIFQSVVEMGAEKARQPWWKTFWLGILAGVYLSLGGALAISVGGSTPELQQTNPGAQKLLFGAFGLPLGLGLIIICGAELYTTNAAWLPAAVYEGRANMMQLGKSWFFSFFGNLCGSLIVVWLADETFLWDNNSARVYPMYLAEAKTGAPFGSEIVRGMGCNLLVCLAAWQAQASQDIISKIFGILFPVLAFVAIGFSHVVANMFWVPFGIKSGAPVSVGRYIVRSMIPDWIGNTIVAAFFLAGSYSFCYGTASVRLHRRFMQLLGRPVDDPRLPNDSAHEASHFGPHDKLPQHQQQAHARRPSTERDRANGV